LVWAGLGLVRALTERGHPAFFIAPYPPIDGLTAHPIDTGRLTDGHAVSDDGEDRVITLFHFAELHEYSAHLLALAAAQGSGGRCQGSAVTASQITRYWIAD
jgi:hypothetical protein